MQRRRRGAMRKDQSAPCWEVEGEGGKKRGGEEKVSAHESGAHKRSTICITRYNEDAEYKEERRKKERK